jgi:hypothetical protein
VLFDRQSSSIYSSAILEMATGSAALFEIFLVIFLGAVEFASRGNFRGNGPLKFSAGVERGYCGFGFGFLFGGVKKDRGAVLLAEVRALPIHLRGIVQGKERLQQSFESNLFGIVGYLDDFGVAGFVGAHIFVRGIFCVSIGIADCSFGDSRNIIEGGFDAPEAAGSECGNLAHVLSV